MRGSTSLAAAMLLLRLAHWVAHPAGQGLGPLQASTVGTSSTLTQLQQLYKDSQAWKQAYKQRPSSACSKAGSASLCAAQVTSAADAYAQLMLATSPQVYSSTNSAVRIVAAAQDQGPCQTCAAFAVAAAAETAMAAALQVDVQQCSISVQALYFCPLNEPSKTCDAGWNLPAALEQLRLRSQRLPTSSCLPYKPDYRGELLEAAALCSGSCKKPSVHAGRGKFRATQITSKWMAQRHIRQYGSVLSRFDVFTDFRAFFANKSNAKAVYRPSAGAHFAFNHAIVLVGYNNQQQYWVAKNSYGSTWGDGGMFKVAYDVCSVLTPGTGEAYGVIWTPSSTPDALQLPVTPGPTAGCYLYKARPGDYLSRVAWLARIPLDRFMLDNIANVKDLDAPLQGRQLLLCQPQQGTFFDASKTDPQLEALLRVKAAIDTTGVLHWWNRAAGAGGAYCSWKGVKCIDGTFTVEWINIHLGKGIQGLRGTLPPAAAFGGLGGLTNIGISDQPGISGTVPAGWSHLTALKGIRLVNNSLSGNFPSSWGSLTKLKVLYLWGNKLSGPIPDSLRALTALEELELYENALSGSLPAGLGSLTTLRVLRLDSNKLSGPIPDSWRGLAALEELAMSSNALSGSLPASMGSLTKLRVLYLYSNKLSGPIPDSLRALTALEELAMSSNALSGSLPAWLGSLTNLQSLILHTNQFTGSIPASLGSLRRLKVLYLGGNKLGGTLPDAFKALTALEEPSLRSNNLVGSVPASWSGMKGLKKVWLRDNPQLGGCLPVSWRQQLVAWDVDRKVLAGTSIKGFC